MLNPIEKKFTWIFILIVSAELIATSLNTLIMMRYLTKPAIVVSLIVFVAFYSNLNNKLKTPILLALGFSALGDILLLLVERSPSFFTAGLLAFLLAHIMYLSLIHI